MSIHAAAEVGFTRGTAVYARARPGYPAAAVAWLAGALGLARGRRVVEIAAGTGKLSDALLAHLEPRDLVAVEPVAAMGEAFAARHPEVELRAAVAESLPLPDASADAVVVGQAFHWFDGPAALAEIHRVLRPGGGLGLIWNLANVSVPWVAEYTALIHAHAGDAPRYATGGWRDAFAGTPLFTSLEERSFPHPLECSVELLVDRAASVSYVAALPPAEHEALRAEVRRLLGEHPDTRARASLLVPYRTDVFCCRRREADA